jgi:ATP-dependent RNA helicase SUPV3L1/SUV3
LLLSAWEQRAPAQVPAAQDFGGRAVAPHRANWVKALEAAPQGDAAGSLLRLEMAAELPTPAEHLDARRAMQLQLLTRRNDPSPAQTWGQDAAAVLAAPFQPGEARRLQNALKVLLRK